MARKTRRSVPIENRVQTEKPAKLRLPRVHLGYVPLLFIVTVTIMVLVMIWHHRNQRINDTEHLIGEDPHHGNVPGAH